MSWGEHWGANLGMWRPHSPWRGKLLLPCGQPAILVCCMGTRLHQRVPPRSRRPFNQLWAKHARPAYFAQPQRAKMLSARMSQPVLWKLPLPHFPRPHSQNWTFLAWVCRAGTPRAQTLSLSKPQWPVNVNRHRFSTDRVCTSIIYFLRTIEQRETCDRQIISNGHV